MLQERNRECRAVLYSRITITVNSIFLRSSAIFHALAIVLNIQTTSAFPPAASIFSFALLEKTLA